MSEADEDINNQVGDLPFKAAKNKGSKRIRSRSCDQQWGFSADGGQVKL